MVQLRSGKKDEGEEPEAPVGGFLGFHRLLHIPLMGAA